MNYVLLPAMGIGEDIKLALRSIRSNWIRTVLTIAIIAFGIMSLVGILTSIDGIKAYITKDFSYMGANTFNIRNRDMFRHGGERQSFRPIRYREAQAFQKRYPISAKVSISSNATGQGTIKHDDKETNPNVTVKGIDRAYLRTAGLEIKRGRNFSSNEIDYGSNVAVIGKDIQTKLFPNTDTIVNQRIRIGSQPYKVVGTLQEKGTSGVFSPDNIVLIPLQNARENFSSDGRSFQISVALADVKKLPIAISEAEGLFRNIRKVRTGAPNNFEIVKSDNLARQLIDNLRYVTAAATLIGFITLLGASVGLMNILLVAVSERTREIGICKAIGATSGAIKRQFLIEAILICQLGGILGIVLGILAGNAVMSLMDAHLILPWKWIIAGLAVCFVVGILSGLYPAFKAARLNPIDALRYE
jgi:putative ABC transport system permease protein